VRTTRYRPRITIAGSWVGSPHRNRNIPKDVRRKKKETHPTSNVGDDEWERQKKMTGKK
jgi:hypothetical protein